MKNIYTFQIFPREKDIINSMQRRDSYKNYNLSELQENYGFVSTLYGLESYFTRQTKESHYH